MSQTFTDKAGRAWVVAITVESLRRVKAALGLNLAAITPDLMESLGSDPVLLADVLYALVKPQAAAQQVTSEQFTESMDGDALDAATTALLEALADFFPSSRREVLRGLLAKARKLEEAMIAQVKTDLARPLPEAAREPEASIPGS